MITIQRMVPDTENRTFIQFHKLFTLSFYLHVFLLQNHLKKTKGYLSTSWGRLTFLFVQQGHINAITAITNTYKCLVCDTLYSKQCVHVCRNFNNNPIRWVLLLSHFYRCGNWGAKRVSDLPKPHTSRKWQSWDLNPAICVLNRQAIGISCLNL